MSKVHDITVPTFCTHQEINVAVLGFINWLLTIYSFIHLSGNEFMRSNQHLKAVELYTCAIALSRKNAIYYCNRYETI